MKEYKWELIWYDMECEKKRDIVMAADSEEAIKKGYSLYGGSNNAPARLVTASRVYSE